MVKRITNWMLSGEPFKVLLHPYGGVELSVQICWWDFNVVFLFLCPCYLAKRMNLTLKKDFQANPGNLNDWQALNSGHGH